ncbi:MAG: CPBP family intramembrane metalloprotease [Actinobacteria bacterium]|nr:CPBP family intramembrane metalloprotease [Actinomycetota bacterium]
MESAEAPRPSPWRLVAWLGFVSALAALGYASRFSDADPPEDLAYRYSSSVAAVVQYGIMLAILLLIARGLPLRDAFGLHRPASWLRALGYALLALAAIYVAGYVYVLLSGTDPTDEQGLVPNEWDPDRAGAFVAFFVAVSVVAPIVEELTYRGLGFSLLRPYGAWVAILVTGILFGAAHGLVEALPVLTVFGLAVGWLRARTASVYPSMILHGFFNGLALIVSVSGAG